MNKKLVIGALSLFVLTMLIVLSIEESRTFVVALVLRVFLFFKHNIVALLAAFFLVNGKFILTAFIKKIAFLSATGLGKRYLIEKVINHNLKIHFFDHIRQDIKRLFVYIKNNFKKFPLVKQVIAGVTFLASLSYVAKFMGGMIAVKVFIAKFWSFILAMLMKSSAAVVYFFTDYLWGSWIAPVLEVLIFSWILEWLERIPFVKTYLLKIYAYFMDAFRGLETLLEKVFHIPLKRFFKMLARHIKAHIYTFIDYRKVSAWWRLQEVRALSPNRHHVLMESRKERRKNKSKERRSLYRARKEKKKNVSLLYARRRRIL